jgi:rhodanese-related sulfurtransferase
MKSRAAFVKAQEWGIANVYVYRSGVFDWVKQYPDQALFMGKDFVGEPDDYFLPSATYQAHCLTPLEFIRVSHQAKTVVFDIRDVPGRHIFPITLDNIEHYPVDRVVKLIKSGSRKISRKKLLILDGCGIQSKWLQYVLEEAGARNYFFLEGGVLNWRKIGLDNAGRPREQ